MGIILFFVIYVPIYLIGMCLFIIISEHYYIEKKADDIKQLV
jgi:hypothetical protein